MYSLNCLDGPTIQTSAVIEFLNSLPIRNTTMKDLLKLLFDHKK